MAFLGEPGTEQFTVETRVDGKTIRVQKIHDPFISSTTVLVMDRWSALKHLLFRTPIRVEVIVHGSHAAMRRIMTLDPVEMQRESEECERERFPRLQWNRPSAADARATEP